MILKLIQILLLANGIGMVVIWTKDILSNPEIDLSKSFFAAQDNDSGSLFWPHWLAEYSTALCLILSVILILFGIETGDKILPFAVGALFYTSLNSLGWTFARKERKPYAFPMLFALFVSLIYFGFLILK